MHINTIKRLAIIVFMALLSRSTQRVRKARKEGNDSEKIQYEIKMEVSNECGVWQPVS